METLEELKGAVGKLTDAMRGQRQEVGPAAAPTESGKPRVPSSVGEVLSSVARRAVRYGEDAPVDSFSRKLGGVLGTALKLGEVL